ncbi:putative uncharacterized protein DDB_G0287113 isoform X1 [Drosophila pseudoobscura]|uniref:MADF domain-containing protein n=1 Tax=Drosophila pseudoobscura pseudoobscura TaxID=46245 RepID=A0A6I8UBW8_DROPS|nr:putative uncharacterized protein DDB_G0287113 isoform X1 [Drosophila pseudoobscura]
MEPLPCASQHHQQSPQQQQQQQLGNLSMDSSLADNVVSIPKELILLSLVSQQQCLYNPKHPHYRSTKSKDEKWAEIGGQVGWSDTQCKGKWKALRDQYCRELKRAKTCAKPVKWKYFKELDFLRPYALARNYRGTSGQNANGVVSTEPPLTLPISNSFSSNSSSSQNLHLTGSIKIEDATAATLLDNCNIVQFLQQHVPSTASPGAGVVTTATDKKSGSAFITNHINTVMQQQLQAQPGNNWNYLTDAGGATTASSIVQCGTQNATTVVEIVDCVNATNNQSNSAATTKATTATTTSASTHNHSTNAEEEDDDPIHTFLNMESYFEKELITLIQQEDMIYNYGNENYRNAKLKMEVWEEIARKLKKSVKQCRLKWKALRDQYAREHKRLRTMMQIEATSRWKHYDTLSFLQKYIQQKALEADPPLSMLLPKHDLEEHLGGHGSHSPPTQPNTMETSSGSSQLNMALPPLTGPHKTELANALQEQQQQQQQQEEQNQQARELCVASYDEMDIENYINGDAHHNDEDEEDEDEEMESTTVPEPTPQQQEQHVVGYDHDESSVYMAVQSVSNALTKHEHHNDTSSNLEQQQQQQLQSAGGYQQKLDVELTSRYQNAATTPCSTPTSRYYSNQISPLKSGHLEFPASGSNGSNGEEDEIGAFFKAVAMKIRSAHMEPVAFTDLQIDILRVINDALRNP